MSRVDITGHLDAWNEDPEALARLLPEVVDELRRIARRYFARERPGHTLEPTALVNEVYLRLEERKIGRLGDRDQFFACVARLMRQVLVDHARARRAAKRGGDLEKVGLEELFDRPEGPRIDPDALIDLDGALDRLEKLDPRQRAIVELRYFAGLTMPEIAGVLDVSVPTVERGWAVARRFLAREMGPRVGP